MKKSKEKETDFNKLRSIINDGFKEYDGDIREEALEVLTEVEKDHTELIGMYNGVAKDLLVQKKYSEEQAEVILELDRRIKDQERTIKDLNDSLNAISRSRYGINHGTGAMDINVRQNSSIVWNELAEALQHATATVPLPNLVNAIKNISPLF